MGRAKIRLGVEQLEGQNSLHANMLYVVDDFLGFPRWPPNSFNNIHVLGLFFM